MFKSARWRSEKSKIKAVFMMQFQATQLPQLKAKGLTLSLVPEDVGKPTVRLEKAAITDGTCFWENPVYEAVKIIKDLKTGTFNEKFYYFVVSTGSSKKGFLGEALINFADFVGAAEPLMISMPLMTPNGETGAFLHVTIHNIQGSVDERDNKAGESRAGKLQNGSLEKQDECINEFTPDNNEHYGSFKNLQVENSITCQDDTTPRQNSISQKRATNALPNVRRTHQRSNTDWSMDSGSDISMIDIPNSIENSPGNRMPEGSDRSVQKLEREISTLERQAELLELELQSLRKQIMKESKRGQDLSREILNLREERDAIEKECEELKSLLKCSDDVKVMETENLKVMLDENRRELNHEKGLNATMRLQLQKTEDSNSELILAVRDLEYELEQKNQELAEISTMTKSHKESAVEVFHCNNEAKEVDKLTQKIADLSSEIEFYRKEREEMKMNIKELATDHGILKQEKMKMQNECSEYLATIEELKGEMDRLEKEMDEKALELSKSSDAINELHTQVRSLEMDLEKQAKALEDDLESITVAKIEQEQRAIRAEEALRKTKSNNAIAAERHQEEFRRLSLEMSSKFDENERLTTLAVTEANDLRLQKRVLEEMLQKTDDELSIIKEQYEVKVQELSKQVDMQSKQIERMTQELNERCMQIENLKKQAGETCEPFITEIEKLKAELESLKRKNGFSDEAEDRELRTYRSDDSEQMKTFTSEQNMLKRWSTEKEELEKAFSLAKIEAQKLREESDSLRSLKNEKEIMVSTLQSDIEKLRIQYNELKHCMSQVELEKEKMRTKVDQLQDDLQEMAESSSEQATNQDKEETTSQGNTYTTFSGDFAKEDRIAVEPTEKSRERNLQISQRSSPAGMFKENEVGSVAVKSELETCSENGLNLSTFSTNDDCHLTQLLSEMAVLKEKNKYMEGELKEMQERYSEISLKFAEVEGERQQLVMTIRNLKNNKEVPFSEMMKNLKR
ncbi:hypothetical protein NMG60_11018120 [Bertholletia excelsa]